MVAYLTEAGQNSSGGLEGGFEAGAAGAAVAVVVAVPERGLRNEDRAEGEASGVAPTPWWGGAMGVAAALERPVAGRDGGRAPRVAAAPHFHAVVGAGSAAVPGGDQHAVGRGAPGGRGLGAAPAGARRGRRA